MKAFLPLLLVLGGWTAARSAPLLQYNIGWQDLTPPGADGGTLAFTTGSQVGGDVTGQAALWMGPSHTYVNLHPVNWTYSSVSAGNGIAQAGAVYAPGYYHAGYWSGTAASFRDINPYWSNGTSWALAMAGNQMAGYGSVNYNEHAAFWNSATTAAIDLHPGAASSSIAWALAGGQQAGSALMGAGYWHASVWSGTATSWKDFNPAGYDQSEIFATTGTQQAGYAGMHAGIWSGTAPSFLDLNPAGAAESRAYATIGTAQAGYASFTDYRHALVWWGAANNYVDLHSVIENHYRSSQAYGLWTDGSQLQVAGTANDYFGYAHPMLWTLTLVPEPGSFCLIAVAAAFAALRLKKKF